jgi:hypothetical protein
MIMAIIAALAGMAIPRFANALAHKRASSAARRVVADLERVRYRAMHASAPQTLTFAGNTYSIAAMTDPDRPTQTYEVDLGADPYGATIFAVDFGGDAEVKFDIYGKPDSGGTVVVGVDQWQHSITLDANTGSVVIE